MPGIFRRLFRVGHATRPPMLPEGRRVYAIGDIHGRLDLLQALADAIESDNASRPAMDSTVILLGDLVDRGPDSAAVVRFAREWSARRHMRFISGNHEEIFLNSFFEKSAFKGLLRFGGIETLRSYGLDADALSELEFPEIREALRDAVPKEDRMFLRAFEKNVRLGDYLFVHAGIHPRVPLDQQDIHDCRWIREPFLSHKGDLGCFVVHGHTVTPQADLRENRIGIDTGAYESDILTALCLEGSERRLIQTRVRNGTIRTSELAANRREELEEVMPGSL